MGLTVSPFHIHVPIRGVNMLHLFCSRRLSFPFFFFPFFFCSLPLSLSLSLSLSVCVCLSLSLSLLHKLFQFPKCVCVSDR